MNSKYVPPSYNPWFGNPWNDPWYRDPYGPRYPGSHWYFDNPPLPRRGNYNTPPMSGGMMMQQHQQDDQQMVESKFFKTKKYRLHIMWPGKETQIIENVTKALIEAGGFARWKDPETSVYHEVSGVPVYLEEVSDN